MEDDTMTNKQKERRKSFTRVICLALAVVMALSVVIAAVMSQVY